MILKKVYIVLSATSAARKIAVLNIEIGLDGSVATSTARLMMMLNPLICSHLYFQHRISQDNGSVNSIY